ncbi:MAG: DEAD/DEAH box helicase, partial [Planctomycetota bacterium]
MNSFGPATRAWFETSFSGPTPIQEQGWAEIAGGRHSLLLAPTGSGKTLAAFLWAIDRLLHAVPTGAGDDHKPGVRVLYVSPLKALAYDVERNLQSPLVGIRRAAEREGIELPPAPEPMIGVRTGDTPSRDRERLRREPPAILVTTPESLYLMLGSRMREALTTVDTVIVDEVHALVPSKRGAHLALSLERLAAVTQVDPQRIGLSATARPTSVVAAFLGGDRPVSIVDTSRAPALDVRVVVPVEDMERPHAAPDEIGDELRLAEAEGLDAERLDEGPSSYGPVGDGPMEDGGDGPTGDGPVLGNVARRNARKRPPGLWPALHDEVLSILERNRTTIVFVNSRGLCERLANDLNQLHAERVRLERGEDPFDDQCEASAVEPLVRAHHGSLALAKRRETEGLLKEGGIAGIVATSSLELGIDMAAVDHVVMVEAPKSVASGLQRIGRAGHGVGETSLGTVLPKHRGDLLESAVVLSRMREGATEALAVPRNPLDVLAQQVVAMVATAPCGVDELERLVQRAAPFRDLTRDLFAGVLDMLSGRYPSTDFADLRPRLDWDRANDLLEPRKGAKSISLTSGGTIPDRGLFPVHLGHEGPRVGELDEEMVHETRTGHVIALGASSWRVLEITRDRVVVEPAPGEPGRLPFWRGEGPGRPVELGREFGAFLRRFEGLDRSQVSGALGREYGLDERAARNLARYLAEQREATGELPTDRRIVVERFRDELGDWRICILSPFGGRVHAPWALAIEHTLSERAGFDVQALWSDDGIVLRFVEGDELPDLEELVPEVEGLEDLVVAQLGHSALFAGIFRENAGRALLLPRRRPGERAPLWMQRLKAQNLLAVARSYPSFPIVLETYRACLRDVFDLPALSEVLRQARAGTLHIHEVETESASPFARSLVFAFTAAYLYEGDAPLAERRAQALALDRDLLRELLGADELRELLDAGALEELEGELQRTADGWRARGPDELHDLLRSLGDLDAAELAARTEGPAVAWAAELEAKARVVRATVGAQERWIAIEDAAAYRDALGVVLPQGLPQPFLVGAERPLRGLVA